MTKTYKDISLNMQAHPGTGDISSVKNEASVAQSIRCLVLTNLNERFFSPDMGGNIQALLFENWSPIVKSEIENRIRSTIKNYEPRARILDVSATNFENSVNISVTFRTQTSVQDAKVNISLERIF